MGSTLFFSLPAWVASSQPFISRVIKEFITRFFPVTLLRILSDLFRGENVTSIWVIKRSLGRSWHFMFHVLGMGVPAIFCCWKWQVEGEARATYQWAEPSCFCPGWHTEVCQNTPSNRDKNHRFFVKMQPRNTIILRQTVQQPHYFTK